MTPGEWWSTRRSSHAQSVAAYVETRARRSRTAGEDDAFAPQPSSKAGDRSAAAPGGPSRTQDQDDAELGEQRLIRQAAPLRTRNHTPETPLPHRDGKASWQSNDERQRELPHRQPSSRSQTVMLVCMNTTMRPTVWRTSRGVGRRDDDVCARVRESRTSLPPATDRNRGPGHAHGMRHHRAWTRRRSQHALRGGGRAQGRGARTCVHKETAPATRAALDSIVRPRTPEFLAWETDS